MNSATWVGRLGPLAFARTLTAGTLVLGAGIAVADAGDSGASRMSAEKSSSQARKAAASRRCCSPPAG